MRRIILAALALTVAGCTVEGQERSAAVRGFFAQQVEAYNAAGINPIQLSPERRGLALLACGTMSGLSTVVRPDAPELSEEAMAWCAQLVKVAE